MNEWLTEQAEGNWKDKQMNTYLGTGINQLTKQSFICVTQLLGQLSPSFCGRRQGTNEVVKPNRRPKITFSADCTVPKKIGTKASQMMQVVYIVKPMGLASLKVSGTPRALMAYTVHVTMSRRL